ncbi:MAG: S1 family peptidase [Mobiluncus porci]|uniref:S1 family peptidase n=1 Tax=Mobiluncus porci TaxID=2652278 RepID=UPI0023F32F5A|nr:S1 family peptidase [Mobiluncus porci]MDD7541918.1 S1 family peptidase [Mobiluncus porci]MDY5748851.1 S1 family peptidase [Mobiluncus porci]
MKKRVLILSVVFMMTMGSYVSAFGVTVPENNRDDTDVLLPEEAVASPWEAEFSEIVTKASTQYSDKYAGAGISEDRNSAWIWFTGGVPRNIIEDVRKLPVNVELRGDLPISLEKLSEKQWIKYQAALRSYPADDLVSTMSVENNEISIHYRPLLSQRTSATRSGVMTSAPDSDGTTVVFQPDASVSSTAEALYGGGYLSNCTAGFSIRKSGVTENGLVTAGHCRSPQRYGAQGQITLTQKGTYIGSLGDISIYHADSGWTAPQFYYAPGKLRNISSVNDTYVGQKICVNGKTTANHCTTVFSVSNCGDGACGLTATNTYITQRGDSGAPWFWNNVGYGIHQGKIVVNGVARSAFTPILKAQQLLGFQVKLS